LRKIVIDSWHRSTWTAHPARDNSLEIARQNTGTA